MIIELKHWPVILPMLLNSLVRLKLSYKKFSYLQLFSLLGYESCIIVGHDIGGLIAWTTAML